MVILPSTSPMLPATKPSTTASTPSCWACSAPIFLGIRYLSVLLSIITIALTFQIGRSLFNCRVGLIAAAALTVSFWSLMYARIGLRHALTPPLAILAFYFFWQALQRSRGAGGQRRRGEIAYYLLSALFTALGFLHLLCLTRRAPDFAGLLWLFSNFCTELG